MKLINKTQENKILKEVPKEHGLVKASTPSYKEYAIA